MNSDQLNINADPSNATLGWVFRERCQLSGNNPFIEIVGERCETFSETYLAATALASGLVGLGVEHGTPVVIMGGNSFASIHALLAVNLIGAVEVAINTAYRGESLVHAIEVVQAPVIVIDARLVHLLADIEDRVPSLRYAVVIGHGSVIDLQRIKVIEYEAVAQTPDGLPDFRVAASDIASVIYTSGTSGPSKGVMVTHAQNLAVAHQVVRAVRLTNEDVFFCAHPLFHVTGKCYALFGQLLTGGKIVYAPKFDAATWLDNILHYDITVTVAHGPMLEMIYGQPPRGDDCNTQLRRVLACPMPKRIAIDFERRFGIRGIEAYGMTEVGLPCVRPYDEPIRIGSCGRVDSGNFELRIADPLTDAPLPAGQTGEILVRTKQPWTLMQGYMGMPEKTVEAWRNLWFHTGDAGYFDDQGYLYFVDRLGDRIRRRAENISSHDVEAAAMLHPAVAECAAVGVASEYESDDDIKLCVVLRRDASLDPREILLFLGAKLPHFMVPRYIEFLDALPRTPTNKIKKNELRGAGIGGGIWDRKAAGISLKELLDTR